MDKALPCVTDMDNVQDTKSKPNRPPPPEKAGESAITAEQCMDHIQDLHDESQMCTEEAKECDKQGYTQQAYTLYNKSLGAIMKAFQYVRNIPAQFKVGEKWSLMEVLLRQLEKYKTEIETQVNALKQKSDVKPAADPNEKMTLEEALDDLADDMDNTDFELGDAANAIEIFSIKEGVQFFHISSEGEVSAASSPPERLAIYKFTDPDLKSKEGPPAFLKVGGWTYPLIPGASPAMHTCWGPYVFPDVTTDEGGSVGLIIPDNVSEDRKAEFERILQELTKLRIEESASDSLMAEVQRAEEGEGEEKKEGEEKERTSVWITRGIITTTEYIQWGLDKTVEKATEWMQYGSKKIKDHLSPAQPPKVIDKRVQKGVRYTRKATGAGVKVSGYVVGKLGSTAISMGRMMAKPVSYVGNKMLPAPKGGEGGPTRMDDITDVAMAGVKGWATVYLGLEVAARSLAHNLSDETVNVVNYKYGDDAGELAENTLYSAVNVSQAAYNYSTLGMKSFAKRVVTNSGKAVANDISEHRQKKKEDIKTNKEKEASNQGDGSQQADPAGYEVSSK